MKLIRLPYIPSWSYHSKPSDSRPHLAEILLDLDKAAKIEIGSGRKPWSSIDGKQIPLGWSKIQDIWSKWEDGVMDVVAEYDPAWEGYFHHQVYGQ